MKILNALWFFHIFNQVSSFEYHSKDVDGLLDQRSCISASVGFEFLEYGLSQIMDRYIHFYNDPLAFLHKRKDLFRYRQVELGLPSFDQFKVDINLVERWSERG